MLPALDQADQHAPAWQITNQGAGPIDRGLVPIQPLLAEE
jgi:hypothetical protein